MNSHRPTYWRYWLPAIAWAGLIFLFSTSAFSGIHTARWITPILKWLMPGATPLQLSHAHELIRKLGHFAEFFVFSLLVFRGFRGPGAGWHFSWAAWTMTFAICYAALDEVHQLFVPVRGASIRDVVIDSFGALSAQFLLWVFYRLRRQ